MISESNLSDVCQVEEFDLNKDRSTEKILDQLNVTGNPHDLSRTPPCGCACPTWKSTPSKAPQ